MSHEQPKTGPRVRMVVAYGANRAIGKDNALIWNLPGDLQHFKRETLGHPIIMGRLTWESLGRPLPGRKNVVLTRAGQGDFTGASVYDSLDAALDHLRDEPIVCIIGGAQLYAQALERTHEVVATEIHASFEADAYFPPLPEGQWREVSRQSQPPENGLAYDFVVYEREA